MELVRSAITDARELLRLEIALAKEELQRDLTEAKSASITAGVAVVLALTGLASLVVALGLALGPFVALFLGLVLLAGAGGLGYAAFRGWPKKPMSSTVQRLQLDENIIGGHLS